MNRNLLTATLFALALSFGTAYAEKGAEVLGRLTKASRAPVAAVNAHMAVTTAHRCPTCTDTFVSVVDKGTKGPNHLVSNVIRHNCGACETKIATEGTGKARHDVAIHSCNAEVKPLCCAKN